jgi:hypothetical protein
MTEVTRCPNCNTVMAFDGGYPESQLDQLETAAKTSIVTPSEAAREAAYEIAGLESADVDRVAAIIFRHFPPTEATQDWCDHCSADLNDVKHILCERCYREYAGPKWTDPAFNAEATQPAAADVELNQEQLDALTQSIARDVRATTRANTISECIEKLSALSTLPFDATLYIRRDDAVAMLEALTENSD